MNKYEYFEFRYSQSNDRCIEEMGKLPDTYDNYQMKNMCEYFFEIGFDMRSNIIKELKKENEKLRECVEFYAYEKSWIKRGNSMYKTFETITPKDSESYSDDPNNRIYVGGKLARKTLEEINKLAITLEL